MQRCHIVTGARDASRTQSRVSGDACPVHNQDLHASIQIVIALWQRNTSTLPSEEKRRNSSVWSNSWGRQRGSVYDTTVRSQSVLSITWGTRRIHSCFSDRGNPQRFVAAPLMRKMFAARGRKHHHTGYNMTTLTTNRCSRAWSAMGARWVPGCVFWSRVRLISLMHWRPAKYCGGYGND